MEYTDTKILIKDNLEEIIKSIDKSKEKIYEIFLINPHPSKDFRLKFKKGETNYQELSFFKNLFKRKFTYPWDVYQKLFDNGDTNLYNIEEIKNYIKYKYNYQAWLKYIYKEGEEMPIWENYAIHIYYKDKYGNPKDYSTYYNLITEDKEEANDIYNKLREKYIDNK